MTTKYERQGMIMRLVQEQPLSTQADVADALRAHGIDAVQATVSRDISQLGLVKVRNPEGRLVYAVPGAADLRRLDELTAALRRWLGGMTPSGQLLVVNTPRGFAAALADAIDADPDLEARLARAYPVGRLGRVEDPAPLAVLLCSDAAEWITGQVYPVDGGYAPAL